MDSKYTKYQKMLLKKMNIQVQVWSIAKKKIPVNEIYQFLHTVTGTAGTIALSELSHLSADLMGSIHKESAETWDSETVMNFLQPLQNKVQKLSEESKLPSFAQSEMMKSKEQEEKPLLLIIDNDVPFLIYLKEELEKNGWTVFVSASLDKGISLFYDLMPDCIIVDYYLTDTEGLQFIKQVKDTLSSQLIPAVVISQADHKEERIKSYEVGADDFIGKPIDIQEFTVRINRQLTRKKMVKDSLMKDELTKVFNRKFLNEFYYRLCAEHMKDNSRFSLVIIDLDHFKKVNDSYGHVAGDYVLFEFASLLNNHLSSQDIIIRYGGEEFIVLMPHANAQDADKKISGLLRLMNQKVFQYSEHQFTLTFSAGIYELNGSVTLSEAINTADSALYLAKEKGRSRTEIACYGLDKKRKLKVAIIDDSEVIRKMLEQYLKTLEVENFTLEIHTYENGIVFFEDEWHQSKDQYLIILDGVLPKMDGTEILQRLRQYPEDDRYTILMLTARKEESHIVRALNLGADDYLTKPFSIRELEARIKVLTQRMK